MGVGEHYCDAVRRAGLGRGTGTALTRAVNDKLWFSDRVTELLGRRALPPTHYVFGPRP